MLARLPWLVFAVFVLVLGAAVVTGWEPASATQARQQRHLLAAQLLQGAPEMTERIIPETRDADMGRMMRRGLTRDQAATVYDRIAVPAILARRDDLVRCQQDVLAQDLSLSELQALAERQAAGTAHIWERLPTLKQHMVDATVRCGTAIVGDALAANAALLKQIGLNERGEPL